MTDHIDGIIAGMSEAQKRYMTVKAEFRKPVSWAAKRWMTFPPANVHRVLMRLGLVDRSGQILPLGLAVRARLGASNG